MQSTDLILIIQTFAMLVLLTVVCIREVRHVRFADHDVVIEEKPNDKKTHKNKATQSVRFSEEEVEKEKKNYKNKGVQRVEAVGERRFVTVGTQYVPFSEPEEEEEVVVRRDKGKGRAIAPKEVVDNFLQLSRVDVDVVAAGTSAGPVVRGEEEIEEIMSAFEAIELQEAAVVESAKEKHIVQVRARTDNEQFTLNRLFNRPYKKVVRAGGVGSEVERKTWYDLRFQREYLAGQAALPVTCSDNLGNVTWTAIKNDAQSWITRANNADRVKGNTDINNWIFNKNKAKSAAYRSNRALVHVFAPSFSNWGEARVGDLLEHWFANMVNDDFELAMQYYYAQCEACARAGHIFVQ